MFIFLILHNWFYKEVKRSVTLKYTLCHIRCHSVIHNYKFSNMESFGWVTVLIFYQTDSPLKNWLCYLAIFFVVCFFFTHIWLFGDFEDWNLNSWKSIHFLLFVLSVSTFAVVPCHMCTSEGRVSSSLDHSYRKQHITQVTRTQIKCLKNNSFIAKTYCW